MLFFVLEMFTSTLDDVSGCDIFDVVFVIGPLSHVGYSLDVIVWTFSSESVSIVFVLSFLDVLESELLDIQLRASCTANAAAALTPSSSKT